MGGWSVVRVIVAGTSPGEEHADAAVFCARDAACNRKLERESGCSAHELSILTEAPAGQVFGAENGEVPVLRLRQERT